MTDARHDAPLWTPDPDRVARANLTSFVATLRESGISSYAALHRWSVEQPETFWPAVWRFCDIRACERTGLDPWAAVGITTTGWMMWYWQASALATGASIVLYDGAPLVPPRARYGISSNRSGSRSSEPAPSTWPWRRRKAWNQGVRTISPRCARCCRPAARLLHTVTDYVYQCINAICTSVTSAGGPS